MKNKPPTLLVGAPGTGKTEQTVQQYEHCEVLLLSAAVEEDIAGLPYREGAMEMRTKPAFLDRLSDAHARGLTTCLFLDELDKARREVADTLLTLVASRKWGQWALPEATDIVAAANPPEWGGGDGVSKPMQSRFVVVDFKPDVAQWLAWATDRWGDVSAFVRLKEKIANGEVPLMEANGEGWSWRLTCPRTWTHALDWCIAGGCVETTAKGLLTPNAASALIAAFTTEDSAQLMDRARRISRKAVVHNEWRPLRT